MDIIIRLTTDNDANACGRICYEGFRAINERYGFPLTFPSVDIATQRVGAFNLVPFSRPKRGVISLLSDAGLSRD